MAKVFFTPQLRRFLDVPSRTVPAGSVRGALEAVFEENPRLKSYILDDQERLRKHVVIFVDGALISDRSRLTDGVTAGSEIHVLQALSGG